MTVQVELTRREVEAAYATLDAALHDAEERREFFSERRDERAALRATEKLRAARSAAFVQVVAR